MYLQQLSVLCSLKKCFANPSSVAPTSANRERIEIRANPATDNMLSLVKTSTPSSAEYIAFRGQPCGLQLDQPEVSNFNKLHFHVEVSLGLSSLRSHPKCTEALLHNTSSTPLCRDPVNRGMPLNCTKLLLSRIRQRPPWSHVFLPYSRRLLRATTRHTVSTRQFNSLPAKSSAAMARRQHDSPTERNQEAHLGHQSAGSATQQASTFESKPPNRFSKRHFPHSWEVSHTCSLTSAAILSTKVFPVLQNNNLVS